MVDTNERIGRSALSPEKLITTYYDDVTTLHEAFKRGVDKHGDAKCLGRFNGSGYDWISYKQVFEKALDFGSGLLELGVEVGQDTSIGIYTKNCPEWSITEQAANAYSQVLVPLYDTLGAESVGYIVRHSKIQVIVADGAKLDTIIERCIEEQKLEEHEEKSQLRVVVKIGDLTEQERSKFGKFDNIILDSFEGVQKRGAKNRTAPQEPSPDNWATICYTSGTTGKPKGVIMTHRNMIADVSSLMFQFAKSNMPIPVVGPDDVHISYLPLAHMFERMVHLWIFCHGAKIGFFRGDIKKLTDDIKLLRPTIFPSVPRLLNRVYDKVVRFCVSRSAPLSSCALRPPCAQLRRAGLRAAAGRRQEGRRPEGAAVQDGAGRQAGRAQPGHRPQQLGLGHAGLQEGASRARRPGQVRDHRRRADLQVVSAVLALRARVPGL